jgi:hypothetical protein
MNRMKTLCMALFAVFALGAAFTATAAFAELPDVHVLSGETYPVTGEGTLENGGAIVAELETEIGEKLTATALKASAELKELSSLGPGTLKFNGVTEPKSKTLCHSTNTTVEGEVLFSGEYHVVNTSTSPLTAQILILFNELLVECNGGKLKIKVRAPAIVKLEKVTSGTDVTEYGLVANCVAKAKQELKEYLNEEGKLTKGVLTANFGLGFETACERTTKELVLKSSKMIDFLF